MVLIENTRELSRRVLLGEHMGMDPVAAKVEFE
jgi:hypothetical protein